VTLNFEATSPRTVFWPYTFAGSYSRVDGASVAEWSFATLPHWSLRYAPGHEPPHRAPFWIFAPCAYRYEEDGAYYDYVLVQGARDPFEPGHPGPPFVRVASSGIFTLYAKTAGPAAPSEGDRGPCATDAAREAQSVRSLPLGGVGGREPPDRESRVASY
jgi:hypothetical protein